MTDILHINHIHTLLTSTLLVLIMQCFLLKQPSGLLKWSSKCNKVYSVVIALFTRIPSVFLAVVRCEGESMCLIGKRKIALGVEFTLGSVRVTGGGSDELLITAGKLFTLRQANTSRLVHNTALFLTLGNRVSYSCPVVKIQFI